MPIAPGSSSAPPQGPAPRRRRRRRQAAAAVAALVVLLGACSSGDDEDATSSPDPTSAPSDGGPTTGAGSGATGEDEEAEDPAEVVVDEVEVSFGPATLTVAVHPLVRVADGLVLTLDATAEDPADVLGRRPTNRLRSIWGSNGGARLPDWVGLRLLDLADDRVAGPVVDADGEVIESTHDGEEGKASRIQLLYGDPGADELALFVPQGGLVTGIPVIDAELPAVADEDALATGAAASTSVSDLTSYSVDLETTTRTEQATDRITIELGADVLFELDSADLTPAAADTIAAAGAALRTREPGPVQVVGHTDSSGTDAYNLDLSRRRAEAVAGALRQVVDEATYPLQVEGRGEGDPVAENSSEVGRATNRRVELTIETGAQEGAASAEVETDLPPIEGPVAEGADGVDVEVAGRTYHVTAPRGTVVDGHLVVDLELTATDDEVGSAFGPAIFEGVYPSPPGLARIRTMAGVAVVNGTEATIPALHLGAESVPDALLPLTDLVTFSRLDGGDVRRSVLVFPRGVPTADTATLQLLDLYGETAWRLTGIPVD